MFKKYRVIKWIGVSILSLVLVLVSFGFWFKSLIPPRDASVEAMVKENLPYLSEDIVVNRGKILAVVTSTDNMGDSGKSTGYELSELARAYYVFEANGFTVDIASPKGGTPPVVIDDEDMGPYDFAFLNDSIAKAKRNNTLAIQDVIVEEYEAVFFAGGKGAMYDFPDNQAIQALIRNYNKQNKVIGAVCHGPAALVNVILDNGKPLLENKNVSAFTNKEELLLISDTKSIFPFLLQDKIVERGANFNEGSMYLERISHDNNLVTGQNPWSTWAMAETMISQMGFVPKHRTLTNEENAVKILSEYHHHGKQEAKQMIKQMLLQEKKPINRVLLAKHSIIEAMKGKIGNFYDLLSLVSFIKKHETQK